MGQSRLTREEAEASLAAYALKHPDQTHIRKAYAALGDDTTLSRFVKIKGASSPRKAHGGATLASQSSSHRALELGHSIFHGKGVKKPSEVTNLLVSGHANVKIGRDVRKGRLFRGYWIYTLTLEERATCPRSCVHWSDCYGNNMPWAKRLEHGDELMEGLRREIPLLLAKKGRSGVLIRLHALGDFWSAEYVWFWRDMLWQYPNLAIYGYTARHHYDPIGFAIATVKRLMGNRFAIRWSDGGEETDCTVSITKEEAAPNSSFVCPEQTGKTAACATCGLCWGTDKNVAFINH